MRKLLILLVLALLLSPCIALSETPLPEFEWQRDSIAHWHMDASGVPVDQQAHELDDSLRCIVCGSEVWQYDDGADVNDYDEYGNITRATSFDAEGAVLYETLYAYEYDAEGGVLASRDYCDGMLVGECIYAYDADGMLIPSLQYGYNDDGSWSVNEYDSHGFLVRAANYDAHGTLTYESVSEYRLNDEGWYYEAQVIARYADGETFLTLNDSHGATIQSTITGADGVIIMDVRYEYAYEGDLVTWSRQYIDGALTCEQWYSEEGYLHTEVHIDEDGSWTLCLYDSEGELLSEEFHDAPYLPVE